MDLDVRQSGNICTLKLKGPLKSGPPVDEFNRAIQSALDTGHVLIVLNLEAMPVLDSSGIGAIVNALRQAKKVGGDVKLVDLLALDSCLREAEIRKPLGQPRERRDHGHQSEVGRSQQPRQHHSRD